MRFFLVWAILFLISFPAFANVKISDMPDGGEAESGDYFPIIRGGANYKAFFPNLPAGNIGDIQYNAGGGLLGGFSLGATSGTGSSLTGLLLNNNGVTQALSVSPGGVVTPLQPAASALFQASQGLQVDPRYFGAQCNAVGATQMFIGGSGGQNAMTFTAGSTTITIPSYTFTTNDINKNLSANLGFNGPWGAGTVTITGVIPPHNAIISAAPTVSGSTSNWMLANDDTSAFNAASIYAAASGSTFIIPNNCAIREWHPVGGTNVEGQAVATNYSGFAKPFYKPVLWVLATGFSDDTTHIGINVNNTYGVGLKGFTISGIVFPFAAGSVPTSSFQLTLIGIPNGGSNFAGGGNGPDALRLEDLTVTNGWVGVGCEFNSGKPNLCVMTMKTFYNEFIVNGWGIGANFSDYAMTGDVHTGMGFGGLYLSGTAGRIIGIRIEESPNGGDGAPRGPAIMCDGCNGVHFEGSEVQFNGGYGLQLNGGWSEIAWTGGFMEGNGNCGATGHRAQIGFTSSQPFVGGSGLHLHNVIFSSGAQSCGHTTQYIFDGTGLVANSTIDKIYMDGGIVCGPGNTGGTAAGFSTAIATWGSTTPIHWGYDAPDCAGVTINGIVVGSHYNAGDTTMSFNASQAMGLQTANAHAGTILDALNASTSNNSSIGLPNGTTANRPNSPVAGMIRLNTTTTGVESYYNSTWNKLLDNGSGVTSAAPGAGLSTTLLSGGLTAVTTTGTFYQDAAYSYGFKGGLTLANDSNTPNTIIDIAPGSATDDGGNVMMKLGVQYTKTTGSWAVGSGNGCLDTGSVANSTWYHVFLIERIDTGVVDVLCSTSGTTPVYPASYAFKRDIGVFQTDGSAHILGMRWIGNNYYRTNGRALEYTTTTLGTSASIITLPDIPPDVSVNPICTYETSTVGACVLFSSPQEKDEAPDCTYPFTAAPGADVLVQTTTAGVIDTGCPFLTTNSTQQIRARSSSANTTLAIALRGFTYNFTPANFSLNFLTGALPAAVTFTRASPGSYFNSAGFLSTTTTNQPRFDYDPVTLTARGLLVEESSTNKFGGSSPSSSSWTGAAIGLTIAANAAVSPDGTTNAASYTDTTSNSSHRTFSSTSGATVSGQRYTFSGYFKSNTATAIQLAVNTNITDSFANFNLGSGTVGTSGGAGIVTAIQSIGNGWYRCSITQTSSGTGSIAGVIALTNSNPSAAEVPSYVGTVTGVYAYGMQMEQERFPTSYIATSTGVVTRAVDSVVVSNPPLFNAAAGSFTVQAALEGTTTARAYYTASYSDGTTANNISTFINSSDAAQAGDVVASSPFTSGAAAGSPTVGTTFTQTVKYIAANNKVFFNGSADTAGTFGAAALPTGITTLQLGDREDHTLTLNGWLQTFSYSQ